MISLTIYLFIIFFGIVTLLLRRNLAYMPVSLLQIAVGFNGMLSNANIKILNHAFVYIILSLILVLILFICSLIILIIRSRSTVYVNELTELRG
jgi:hypothetical protein